MTSLAGKVVLVTGAARGQGEVHARRLVAAGAKVVLGDVLDERGRALARELGPAARYLHHDVTSEADWTRAIDTAQALGGLDGLVNNAGILRRGRLVATDAATFERHARVNQLGCFLGMKFAAQAMLGRGGSVVNISSTLGLRGMPHAFAYCATKWALRGMTKAAAIDLAPHGIRVNSVHPGRIATEMQDVPGADDPHRLVVPIPMNRLGRPEEVTEVVLFLLSDASAYMTGAEVAVDGGYAL